MKIVFGIWAAMILLGVLVDTFIPKPPATPPSEGSSTPPAHQPANHDPRFHGPGHPMYGKNYYQVYNEVVFELRSAGHPEEQIRLACLAMESTKCGYCNGYGRRGHYLCEACRGDGVLEN